MKGELRQILLRHEGKGNAITGKQLAELFGLKDDRTIRETIRELIADGLPVASSTKANGGYFIITNRQEAEEYAQVCKSRLIEDALRRRDFRRASDCWLIPAVQEKLRL